MSLDPFLGLNFAVSFDIHNLDTLCIIKIILILLSVSFILSLEAEPAIFCRYVPDTFTATGGFQVGTDGCKGVSQCQFKTLFEAEKFCNPRRTCNVILKHPAASNCAGGHGCFTPRKGGLVENPGWIQNGGKTYKKQACGKGL